MNKAETIGVWECMRGFFRIYLERGALDNPKQYSYRINDRIHPIKSKTELGAVRYVNKMVPEFCDPTIKRVR